jgi:hypothetical protein
MGVCEHRPQIGACGSIVASSAPVRCHEDFATDETENEHGADAPGA